MFDPEGAPRVFALPPGADFPVGVRDGLASRLAGVAPEEWARVDLFVNTRRMQRRLREVFDDGPARLLPRLRLVTDLSHLPGLGDLPPPVPPLRRRLELTRLVAGLLDRVPDLAPRAALFDLADSLAALMDEMQGEGVPPGRIAALDVADVSGYWQRSLHFVALVERYFVADAVPDVEAWQRRAAERLAAAWAADPPRHPVLVAGSTGSRGTTALLMRAVARLPQGAVILPGFDFDLPDAVWDGLGDALTGEDHPQYRFKRLLDDLGVAPGSVRPWAAIDAPNPARNRLMSLALRPAPVTDQWMIEGPRLDPLDAATRELTLIEAPTSRVEATAIALVLRAAAEAGRKAALITPDRTLTRQVTAALDRWGILPDDSAGRPLPLTAPGRFLRHVAGLFGTRLTVEALLTLLKHPLTHSGGAGRGAHLLHSRDLELHLRRNGPPYPRARDLAGWAADAGTERQRWAAWIGDLIEGPETVGTRQLAAHLDAHVTLAEALARGVDGRGAGTLWDKPAGREAARQVAALRAEAEHGADLSPADYVALFHAVLQRAEVREAEAAHPAIMIWGTLEARVQGTDLVVLGGLNEGVWPQAALPDPWLNRVLRHRAGLLLPERRIGLSAHDFQQAAGAAEVVFSRSERDAETQTVPSRWLNRLCNLLDGVSDRGTAALKAMRGRGARWLAMADTLDGPGAGAAPAVRPAPRPPVDHRPQQLSITEIQTLIRDPYAIYAKRILKLQPLDPLRREPDAPLRGTVLHIVMERFVRDAWDDDPETARARLLALARNELERGAPWPAARRLWQAKLARVADWFIAGEAARRAGATPVGFEERARLDLPELAVTLTGKIDRIDRNADGTLAVYDYKTGQLPSPKQQEQFDKQLLLSALMAEAGAIEGLTAATVREIGYIGLGANPRFEPITLEQGLLETTHADLLRLLGAYRSRDRGYTSRRAMEKVRRGGDYDHLARYGEWDETAAPVPEAVGP